MPDMVLLALFMDHAQNNLLIRILLLYYASQCPLLLVLCEFCQLMDEFPA